MMIPEIEADLVAIARDKALLFQERFVARDALDSEGNAGYQTFRDGWLFQEVIDAIRTSTGWTSIPSPDDR